MKRWSPCTIWRNERERQRKKGKILLKLQGVFPMAKIIPGRFTAQTDEAFVVFIIGMRANKFFAFRKWIATAMAMGPMIRTLYEHPEKGFLGAQTLISWRGITTIQYWRSFEDLEKFARDKDDPHLEAWRKFNKTIGSDGSVGIFHETFQIGRA